MDLLEYQAMPSYRDVAHDGWLCSIGICVVHFLYNSSWKFYQLTAEQLLSGQPVRYGKSRRHGPSITYKITLARSSLSFSQPGEPPCWASPLAFGLIDGNHFLVSKLLFFWGGGGGVQGRRRQFSTIEKRALSSLHTPCSIRPLYHDKNAGKKRNNIVEVKAYSYKVSEKCEGHGCGKRNQESVLVIKETRSGPGWRSGI